MLFLTKSKGHKSNVRISWMYKYSFYNLKVHISICQTQITFVSSLWDTLYVCRRGPISCCSEKEIVRRLQGITRNHIWNLSWSYQNYFVDQKSFLTWQIAQTQVSMLYRSTVPNCYNNSYRFLSWFTTQMVISRVWLTSMNISKIPCLLIIFINFSWPPSHNFFIMEKSKFT